MDPSRNLDETGDLLLRDGKIAAVGGEISAEDARVVHADGLIAAPICTSISATRDRPIRKISSLAAVRRRLAV